MTTGLAGIWKNTEFKIPAGTYVYPVHEINGKLFATSKVKTHRSSEHKTYRLIPVTGNFRSFHYRNKEKGTQFGIALFEKKVKNVVGCIVDFRKIVPMDLPF